MIDESHQHSPLHRSISVPLTLAASGVLSILLGILYAFIMARIPVVYIHLLVTACFGASLGLVVRWCGRLSGIRNTLDLGLLACLTGLPGLYAAWASDGMARFGTGRFPQLLLSFQDLQLYVAEFYELGYWSLRRQGSGMLSGVPLAVVWLGEVGVVLTFACVYAARSPTNAAAEVTELTATKRPFQLPELPLLRRELTELSSRRRTYMIRVIGAVLLFFFVTLAWDQAIVFREQYGGTGSGPAKYLGIGGDIFSLFAADLFLAIQLMLPALCCASITGEKENNTIGTLLLTKLSPGTIVLEKFFSRIVPMLTILLLAFPMLAFIHSLGGVDTEMLKGTVWLLLCECFLIAGIAILCSAWFATTVSALMCSYAVIGVMLMLNLGLRITTFLPHAVWRDLYSSGNSPAQQMWIRAGGMAGTGSLPIDSNEVVFRTLPSLIVAGLLLLTARLVLVRRAFVSSASVLLKLFQSVDGFFKGLNQWTTGGIEVIRDSNPLPDQDPVAWRERNKKSLGKARYLFRIFVVLQGPTLLLCVIAATISAREAYQALYVLQCLIWVLVGLITTVKGATLFPSERAKQTIEPLLASPMSAAELVDQKVAGMRRLLIVLAMPVLSVNLTHFLLNVNFSSVSLLATLQRPVFYLLLSTCGTVVLLYLTAFVSAGVGLKVHSQTKAIFTAVAVTATWIVAPIIVAKATMILTPLRECVMTFSPYSVIEANERFLAGSVFFGDMWSGEDDLGQYWWMFTLPLYSLIVLLVRMCVRTMAPYLLNRRDNPAPQTVLKLHESRVPMLEGTQT